MEHIHEWHEVDGDNETIFWCKADGCQATKDSDGGIIE